MRRVVLLLLALFAISCSTVPSSPIISPKYQPLVQKPIVKIALDCSVIIRAIEPSGFSEEGTGVVVTRNGNSYVWTCAHLFGDIAINTVVKDKKSGTTRPAKIYPEVTVIKRYMDESGISAQIKAQATVVCCDPEQDIALLKLKDNIFTNSTVFYLDNIIPPVGETIHNVGNYKGDFAEYSFSSGVIAYLNRHMISWDYLDQSTFTIYTGSSGSGVFLDDGRCIGIVVMCANGGDSCGFYIPIRRILHWARERKFEYLLNPALPVGQ